MLSQYLLYVCIHIGNSCKIGSTYSVLVCYRNSASWFHLMLPGSSHKGRENNHSFFTFSCQPLFYIALSLLFPVTSFQSWRLLVYLISPSTETIPCLWLSLFPFSVSSLFWFFFYFILRHGDLQRMRCSRCGQILGLFSGTVLLSPLLLVALIPYILFTFSDCRRARNRCFCWAICSDSMISLQNDNS